jgi:tetratricopeptide (TPR) repeat protein
MITGLGEILRLRLLLILILICPATAFSQTSSEVKSLFAQAEAYALYGDFELANPLYLTISAFDPDNCNILYKIGECYLNIPSEKSKAIEFLEKAVKNSSFDAKTSQLKEKRAPLDSYFLLAKAYMINNQLDKALATFQVFQKLVSEIKQKDAMKNVDFVNQQIQACNNAVKAEASPITLFKSKLPPDFGYGSINDFPVVSYDGSTIAYTEVRGVTNVIYYSKKERGKWQPPLEITNDLNAGEDCSTSALNRDGTELFLYKKDNEDGNIYSSNYIDDKWTPIKKLNKNINTKFYESHASISANGKKLYFASNRDGGKGQLDIYVSERDGTGDWGVAVNLGDSINTPYNEDNPFITENDSTLFFTSEGHLSFGGFDVFKSNKSAKGWKKPTNLGYPISTTDDDKFFQPFNNGQNAYYSMSTDYKKKEIFFLSLDSSAVGHRFEINGILSLADTTAEFDNNFRISFIKRTSGDTLGIVSPSKYSGFYSFKVNPDSLKIIYSGKGFLSQTFDTLIASDSPVLSIVLDVRLRKDPGYKPVTSAQPAKYEKIDLNAIPAVAKVDSSVLVLNMKVDENVKESDILYYTVQVMALHKPVDVKYFKYIDDMKVLYNDLDKFYRYTSGRFKTREEAIARRSELIKKGYPEEIFVKKVSKQ